MDVGDFLEIVAVIDEVHFTPVGNELTLQLVRLPGEFYPDPADRLISCLARHHSVALVTTDKKIRLYLHVKTIW